jgi:3-methyladenine DNA glycosylase AlkD
MRRLRAAANPDAASGARAFFKKEDEIVLLGVKAPALRALAREIHGQVKQRWDMKAALRFCEALVTRREHEAKMLGVLLLGRYEREFPRSLFATARQWVAAGHFANWAAIDALCPQILTPLLRRYPALLAPLRRWTASRNPWLRRAAVVTLVPLARRGEQLAAAYTFVEGLLGDREDLMHKACGWLLREAGKTDPDRLERFLLRHAARVPRTTVRYAIERYPPHTRRRLLVDTRGP